jgi:hypothetical protein
MLTCLCCVCNRLGSARSGGGGVNEEGVEEGEDPADATPPNCVICIEGFAPRDYVRELPGCGHVFHKRCIDLWLRGKTQQQQQEEEEQGPEQD